MKKAALIRAGAICLLCITAMSFAFSMLSRIMAHTSNSMYVIIRNQRISEYISVAFIIGYILVAVGAAGKRRGLAAASIGCIVAALVRLALVLASSQSIAVGLGSSAFALLLLPLNAALPIFHIVITRKMKTVWRTLAVFAAIAAVLQTALSACTLYYVGSMAGNENVGRIVAMIGTASSAISFAQTAISIAIMVGVVLAPTERLLPEPDRQALA